MNKLLPQTLFLISFLTLFSCGKKNEEEKIRSVLKENQAIVPQKYQKLFLEIDQVIKNDDLDNFKIIIQNNVLDLNFQNDKGDTYLMEAIEKKGLKIRDYLLERGANVDLQNHQGINALMKAITLKQLETVHLLIQKKSLLDKKNLNGDTALHLAIKLENEEIAILLVRAGANIKITDHDNLTPYDLVANRNLKNLEEILRKSSLIEISPPDMYSFKDIILSGNIGSLDTMLEKYPNIALTYEMLNPLCLALSLSSDDKSLLIGQALLESNVNPNGPYNSECIPLIEAVKLKKVSWVKLLLENKAKTHILDAQNFSPLIHAILKNDLELVKILISYKALIEYKFITADGDQEDIDACDIVRKTKKSLKLSEEKKINKQIKESLNCGFWDWFF